METNFSGLKEAWQSQNFFGMKPSLSSENQEYNSHQRCLHERPVRVFALLVRSAQYGAQKLLTQSSIFLVINILLSINKYQKKECLKEIQSH